MRRGNPRAGTPWRPFEIAAPLCGLFLLTATVLMVGPWLGADRAWIVTDIGAVLADAFVVAAAGFRALSSAPGPARRSWLLITTALSSYLVADSIWAWTDLTGGVMGYPSVADAFFVTAAVPALLGLVLFPVTATTPFSRARLVLDALVVSCALTLISFMVVLRDVFAGLGSGLGAVVNASYPVTDLFFVCLVALLLLRGGRTAPRLDLVLLGLGFVSYAFSDSAFAVVALDGSYESTLVSDVPYLAAPLLIGLAALAPPPVEDVDPSLGVRLTSVAAPDLAVMVALVTSLAIGVETWQDSLLVMLTVALAIGRQVWLAWENHLLREGLEQRVEVRTAENHALAARYQHILESVGEGIVGVDDRGRISFVNGTGAHIVGSEPDLMVGREACATLHGEGAHPAADCPLGPVRASSATASGDLEFLRADGVAVPVEVTSARARGPSHDEFVVVFRDVTERRVTERLKSEFISVVSHELRTPLTSIHGALHLLHDGDVGELPPQAGRMVDVALRGTDRLARLVNDILLMDRLESGALPLHIDEHDCGALVSAVVTALDPIAGVEGVRLTAAPVDCRIRVDADRFVQVLTNLVGNAVKFTPRGGEIRVDVTVGTREAEIGVSDTGPGIAPDHLETVFERFRQLDSSDVRQREGSGLGLAITRSLVEHQGGRIWAESDLGVGSTFRFTVPLAASPVEHLPPAVESAEPEERSVSERVLRASGFARE